MSILIDSFTLLGPNGVLATDIHMVPKDVVRKGTIVFAHGYKGFKDWGSWHVMGDVLAESGWEFVIFNFSHNGHLSSDMMNCTDESSWSKNTYSIEKTDLTFMLTHFRALCSSQDKLVVMGHSRGGGIAALAASDVKVDKLVLLASVSDLGSRFPEEAELKLWKETNELIVSNGRTGQSLSHPFSFYEDFINNRDALDIQRAIRSLYCPLLVIHGKDDIAVPTTEGGQIVRWAVQGEYYEISNTGHTFNTSHPCNSNDLPIGASVLVKKVIAFLR